MERIEFLNRTDQRNLKFHIGFMVKQHMQAREQELDQRRISLRDLLEYENLKHDEELVLYFRLQLEENARKRLEWIGTMRLEREKAEEDLLKLKQLQQELENCEEIRHLKSKELLLETKQAQLYQIEEKKARRLREKQVERMWWEAMQQLEQEKEKHEYFESKLRKVIAGTSQVQNTQQHEEMKERQAAELKELQEELQMENVRGIKIDKQYREQEKMLERHKKLRQADVLQQQMQENLKILQLQQLMQRDEDLKLQQYVDNSILNEVHLKESQKVKNRDWHQKYLEHCQNERALKQERDRALEALQVGGECVLQQQNKKPYGKTKR